MLFSKIISYEILIIEKKNCFGFFSLPGGIIHIISYRRNFKIMILSLNCFLFYLIKTILFYSEIRKLEDNLWVLKKIFQKSVE